MQSHHVILDNNWVQYLHRWFTKTAYSATPQVGYAK